MQINAKKYGILNVDRCEYSEELTCYGSLSESPARVITKRALMFLFMQYQ